MVAFNRPQEKTISGAKRLGKRNATRRMKQNIFHLQIKGIFASASNRSPAPPSARQTANRLADEATNQEAAFQSDRHGSQSEVMTKKATLVLFFNARWRQIRHTQRPDHQEVSNRSVKANYIIEWRSTKLTVYLIEEKLQEPEVAAASSRFWQCNVPIIH